MTVDVQLLPNKEANSKNSSSSRVYLAMGLAVTLFLLALTFAYSPQGAVAASGHVLHRRMQAGWPEATAVASTAAQEHPALPQAASDVAGSTKSLGVQAALRSMLQVDESEPEDPQVTPTGRKGWVYEYHFARQSDPDQLAAFMINGDKGENECAKQCAQRIGCVAWLFGFVDCYGCNGYNCRHYTKVPSIATYAVNFISGYRKKVIPADFKPSKGITVDNTTGIPKVYNDVINSNAPGMCDLAVTCGASDATPAATGNGTGGNTTAPIGLACASIPTNTSAVPPPDNCSYFSGSFFAPAASGTGVSGVDSAEAKTVLQCCKACLASPMNCTAFTYSPAAADDDFQVGSCEMFAGFSQLYTTAAGSGIVSGLTLKTGSK